MQEIMKHHIIRISQLDNIKLFLSNLFSFLCCNCCWKKKEKLQSLYEQTQEKVDAQLDVMKLIQNLAKLKIILKNSLMSPEITCQIQHSAKFLIDIDDLDDESLDDEDKNEYSHSVPGDGKAVQVQKSQVLPDGSYRDDKVTSSNPMDIMKNLDGDIMRTRSRKVSEKKATLMEGMTDG